VVVDPNGPLCDCGKHGCLESYVSDRALLATARNEVSEDIRDFDDLLRRATSGDASAVRVFARGGRLLGQEIANLVNIFDPKLILISGEGVRMGEVFFSPVKEAVRQNVMPSLLNDTEIRVIPWSDDVWARAAASVVIGELFNSPMQKEERADRKH